MQPEDEFRSRLRDDLGTRPAPPVGALVPDALSAGRRMRRRRQTLRAVGGTAAVAAVAVGSVTLSGAFGSDARSSDAAGPGTTAKPVVSSPTRIGAPTPTSHQGRPTPTVPSRTDGIGGIPSSWTLPPAAAVTDPAWVTPRAIVAEVEKLLPAGTATSQYSGDYAYAGGDPREMWAVDGQLTVTTSKGPVVLDLTLHKFSPGVQGVPCDGAACVDATMSDGTLIVLRHDVPPALGGSGPLGASIWVARSDGMSVQVTARNEALWTDDQLFALASNGAWGSLKMDKAFVDHAEATVKGTFMNPPAGG